VLSYYILHAPEDQAHATLLDRHMAALRYGLGVARAGSPRAASILLVLMSADLWAVSGAGAIVTEARAAALRVIPIRLRACFTHESVKSIQAMPREKDPTIAEMQSPDVAWSAIARDVAEIVRREKEKAPS
jgi:hypothetical protein